MQSEAVSFASRYLIYPTEIEAELGNLDPNIVGQKALGLATIPSAWRPPFGVISAKVYSEWKNLDGRQRVELVKKVSADLFSNLPDWSIDWPKGIILRSSATEETLTERGAFESRKLPADFGVEILSGCVKTIYEQFFDLGEQYSIAVVVQPLVSSSLNGHISNERRVSKTINQWELEIFSPPKSNRFNSQRHKPPDFSEPLDVSNRRKLSNAFRSVGRWCTKLERGPAHLEWAWDQNRLWLLQLDFEDESPDEGVDPAEFLRSPDHADNVVSGSISMLTSTETLSANCGWRKIDNVLDFRKVRDQRFPPLYYIGGEEFQALGADLMPLVEDIRRFSAGRVVVRTDCRATGIGTLNLPRTDSVTPERAADFISEVLASLVGKGARPNEVCFILHRFIPAQSSAWALATPGGQLVQVDSLWGVPEGLQYLPYDSFQFDLKRNEISSEKLAYKPLFIQELEDGSWNEVKIKRRLGRHRSISSPAVREIATLTKQLAQSLGQPVQVMWFCGIPEHLEIGENLPWFHMPASAETLKRPATIGEARERIHIHNATDIQDAYNIATDRSLLVLQPEVNLIRKEEIFLDEVIKLAQAKNLPIELAGSSLGHAYYKLDRAGVTTFLAGVPSRERVRGRRVFAKLVRDDIPEHIERKGERVIRARISKSEARAALLVKLLEEAQELKNAESPDEVKLELADLLEVLRSLCAATGVNWDDVSAAADEKRASRGSFNKGVVLMETSWPTKFGDGEGKEPEVKLKSLGLAVKDEGGVNLPYAALLARNADRTIELNDGTRLNIKLTVDGLRIEEVPPIEPELDLGLPD